MAGVVSCPLFQKSFPPPKHQLSVLCPAVKPLFCRGGVLSFPPPKHQLSVLCPAVKPLFCRGGVLSCPLFQ